MTSLTAAFTLPSGSTAYSFYPGGYRNGAAGNDVWLATGTIKRITVDSEVLAGAGFQIHCHDYFDTSTKTVIRGGTPLAAGLLTVVGIGALNTGNDGGSECFSTNIPAAIVTGNRVASIRCQPAVVYPYEINAFCGRGMIVTFNGSAVTTADHKVLIEYEPYKMGGARKTIYDSYRAVVNGGGVPAF